MSEAIATPEAAAPAVSPDSEATPAVSGDGLPSGTPAPSATDPGTTPESTTPEGEQAEAAPTTPTEYTEFVLPAGYAPSEEGITSFKTWAQQNGLTQDQAQAYLNLDAQRMQERQSQIDEAVKQQEQQWAERVKSDPVLGKLPQETKTRVEAAKRFFLKDDPDALEFLKETGWENHPGFVRLMYRAHDAIKHMSPDTFGPGKAGGGRELTLAERMVPEMAKQS